MSRAFVVALLGAESTGKTTLAAALAASLGEAGRDARAVPEVLREFCAVEARTPRRDEQAHIAAGQSRRIEAAAAQHGIVVADTTALQTAVYSELVFGDRSLYPGAEAWQREHVDLVLLTALDLPWQADGFVRDGPQVRAPVDALLRAALERIGRPFGVISGSGATRTANALAAITHALGRGASAGPEASAPASPALPWRAVCERCSDPDCEHRLLARG